MRSAARLLRQVRGGLRPGAEARLAEKDKLSAAYSRDRRERINALCEGPYGGHVKELVRFLRRMNMRSGSELVARVRDATWAKDMNASDRHLLLSIINGSILKMRESEGLPPLDDPLWDEPPNVSQQIKAMLEVY